MARLKLAVRWQIRERGTTPTVQAHMSRLQPKHHDQEQQTSRDGSEYLDLEPLHHDEPKTTPDIIEDSGTQ